MDQKQITVLIELFEKSRLGELKIESEGFKITLKSEGAATGVTHSLPVHTVMPPYQAVPTSTVAPPVPVSAPHIPEAGKAAGTEIITSPIVGSFYRSPAPDAPPYVEELSVVKAGDPLCIIEAMKIMNKLEADFPCEIVRILAENGKMVEFGAPLFEVIRK